MNKAFLNIKQAAALLGVGESTLRREAAKKNCPVYRRKPRGPMQFVEREIIDWWKSSSV